MHRFSEGVEAVRLLFVLQFLCGVALAFGAVVLIGTVAMALG